MKPRKLPLVVAVILGIAVMLAARFMFDLGHNSSRLGFAAALLVLVLFTRPWHNSSEDDDDED